MTSFWNEIMHEISLSPFFKHWFVEFLSSSFFFYDHKQPFFLFILFSSFLFCLRPSSPVYWFSKGSSSIEKLQGRSRELKKENNNKVKLPLSRLKNKKICHILIRLIVSSFWMESVPYWLKQHERTSILNTLYTNSSSYLFTSSSFFYLFNFFFYFI